jgi:hypothetical protein
VGIIKLYKKMCCEPNEDCCGPDSCCQCIFKIFLFLLMLGQ